MSTVKCTYCGHTETLDAEPGGPMISCSACHHQFPVRRIDRRDAPVTPAAAQGSATPGGTSPRIATAIGDGRVRIVCPQCRFSSVVPAEKIPVSTIALTCRQCAHKFQIDGERLGSEPALHPVLAGAATTAAEPARKLRQLRPVGELFTDSWQHFKERIFTLIGVNLLGMLLVVIGFWLYSSGVNLLQKILGQGTASDLLALLFGALYSWLAVAWIAGATVCAVSRSELNVRESLALGLQKILPFLWVFILLGIVLGGGYAAFFLPGVIFTVWFIFAQFIVAADDSRGMEALLRSKHYVRGHGWAVCGRLLLVGVSLTAIGFLLGLVPLLGPFLTLLLGPYAMVYQYEIFRDLRQIRGEIPFSCTTWDKARWLLAGLAGLILVPLLVLVLLGPGMLQGLTAGGFETSSPSGRQPAERQQRLQPNPDLAQKTTLVAISAVNYRGSVRLNGETIYAIAGEQDVNYNYTGNIRPQSGSNLIEVDYAALPVTSRPELRVRVTQMDWDADRETVLGEWLIDDEAGRRSLQFINPD